MFGAGGTFPADRLAAIRLLAQKQAQESLRHKENVFIIHGRDEAKWRELKDIVKSEFRLNPIVLFEQPDAGCQTVIEKFEHYAQTCTYAIAAIRANAV